MNLACAPQISCVNTTTTGSSSSYTPAEIAQTWQEWYDADTLNQIVSGSPSQVSIQLLPHFQAASSSAPTTGFILRIPVQLTATLPQGALMNEGSAGIAACSALGVVVSALGCAFDVVQYSVTLTISVNGQVVQTVNPSTIGSPTFVSFINPSGSEQDVNLFVWLNGNTAPSGQATQAQSFMGSLCSGLCSIFNSGLLSNYVDLRSAVSQYETSSFTVSINVQENWRAYMLYMSDVLNPATLSAGSLASYAYALAAYLSASVNTVNVDNSATGPAWFSYTASCGLSCLSGTFATNTAPTREVSVTTESNGNEQVNVVVSPTTWTTCNTEGCAEFNEQGYSTVIQNVTNPASNLLASLQCSLITNAWEYWFICESTWGYANWELITAAVIVLIVVALICSKIPRRKKRGPRGPYNKTKYRLSGTLTPPQD
jgi:hypothetical protein